MNEQFINELATALRKVGTIHTVGEEWVSYIGEIPNGGVPYCGQEVTRTTYSALWTYAQEKGLVKTEAEWKQIATANGGNVPYYSNGNGSSTFRMPKLVGYIRGASSQSEAGKYVAEGLPTHTHTRGTMNITGAISAYWKGANPIWNGDNAFYTASGEGEYTSAYTDTFNNDLQKFDASRSWTGETSEPSNSIYGNSNHVTPETSVVLFGVYAFGTVVNVGELDARALLDELNTKLPLSGGTMTGSIALMSGDNSLVAPTDNGYVEIEGGTDFRKGASLTLYGKDSTNTPGCFKLFANKGQGHTLLLGDPDGSLTWGGKNIVRSVNGTNADANGNVSVSSSVPAASSSRMGGIKPASAWKKILESTSNIGTYSYTATKNCFVCAYNMGGTNNMTVMASIGGVTVFRDYGHHNDGNNSYPMFYLSKGQTITLTQNSAKLHFSVLDLE